MAPSERIKKRMNDDNQTKSSDIKKNPVETVRKVKAEETRISKRKDSETGNSTRTKKEKCEENSRKKMEHGHEDSRRSPHSNRSKSSNISSRRRKTSLEGKDLSPRKTRATTANKDNENNRNDTKPQSKSAKAKKNVINDDEKFNLEFSAIEDKIFEGFTAAESKETNTKHNRLKKPDAKKHEVKKSATIKSSDRCIERKKSEDKKEAMLINAKSERKDSQRHKKFSEQSSSSELTGRSNKLKTPNSNRKPRNIRSSEKKKSSKEDSDSDMSDWEEVESRNEVMEMEELLSGSQPSISGEGSVQIELDAPNLLWGYKKRKRRTEEEMIEDYLRKSVNRSIKEVYENMHKTHLLCLFAHGRHVNQILNKETLLGAALSIITDKNAYPPKRLDMNYLEKFVKWFSRKIIMKSGDLEKGYWDTPLEEMLEKRFENKTAKSNREFVYMFIVVCRALGMNVRLVLSLQPVSWKPGADVLIKPKKNGETNNAAKGPHTSNTQVVNEENTKAKVIRKEKKPNRKMLSTDDEEEVINKNKKPSKVEAKMNKASKPQKRKSNSSDDENDDDFNPIPKKMNKGPKASTSHRGKRPTDETKDDKEKKRKKGQDDKDGNKKKKTEAFVEWAEIYVEEEEKWVCVDIIRGKIHCVAEIQVRMPSSSAYVTAYNPNLTVKDVTRRYVSHWLSSERKLRLCSKWWTKSLSAFRGAKTRHDKEEDKEMEQNLQHQPLPKTIGEYKNHPLYALQRHLLKFEAIYPPDVSPVGFIRGEPVYPRDSIYTLCSRDTWLKEAKTVRVEEEPYKIVKARPKWDKNTCQVMKDRPLEVFGEWQVEDYEPPVAKDGKVPRNDYGNVELFKPSMLPRGCVHIPINGLNRIARKLNIDCAAAMVGFDFHSGWTHPVYDGFVVCEEFKDTLMDAWNEDQLEQARKVEEKRVKRIYDNWKKLIHGMLIKERVREKYGSSVQEEEVEGVVNEEKEEGIENVAKEMKKEQEEKKSEKSEKSEDENSGTAKKKIKQEDINAARPPIITHHIKNFKIDWSSNVVEVAKKRKKEKATVRRKNLTKKKESVGQKKLEKDFQQAPPKDLTVPLDADSDSETDEEEKKAKIRAILDWGTKAVETNPDLSDDSDAETDRKCPSNFLKSDVHPFYNSVIKPVKKLSQKQQKAKSGKKGKSETGSKTGSPDESEEEISSASTSRSTTPDPDLNDVEDRGCRKSSRHSAVKKRVTYKEEEGESDGDISLDDSDCGDHLYQPEGK